MAPVFATRSLIALVTLSLVVSLFSYPQVEAAGTEQSVQPSPLVLRPSSLHTQPIRFTPYETSLSRVADGTMAIPGALDAGGPAKPNYTLAVAPVNTSAPITDTAFNASAFETVHISITETGFSPTLITVTVGTTVVWTNGISQKVHLKSGKPHCIYLPLVMHNSDRTITTRNPVALAGTKPQQDSWGDTDIAPGGSYTHTFTTLGDYPYFLSSDPRFTGQVAVKPIPFDFALGVSPATQPVVQGESVAYMVHLTGTLGAPQPVTLTAREVASASLNLSPATLTPTGTAILSITTELTTPVGDHTLVITATSGEQVRTAAATLSVAPHPDFVFTIAPSTHTITQGLTVTFTAHLTAESEWNEPVQLSVQGLPSSTSASWAPDRVTPTGSSRLVISTALTTPPGAHLLVAVADGGLFSHTAPITLEVLSAPSPDLVVKQITTSPLTPTINTAFTLSIHVRNQGGSVAQGFQVDWYADPSAPPLATTPGTGHWMQTALTAGETVELTTTYTFTTAGGHSLWAQVDRQQAVTETNETNNTTGPVAVTVNPPPDFSLAAMPTARTVTQGNSAAFDVDINGQYGFFAPVSLALSGLPGGASAIWSINPAAPDATVALTVSAGLATPPGIYPLTIQGSGGGLTHTTGVTLTIIDRPLPDLIIESLSVTPATPAANTPTTITVVVRNQGTGNALGTFRVDWYDDPAAPPSIGDIGTTSWSLTDLEAGSTKTLKASHTFTTVGPHVVWAQVDGLNQEAETDEANNVNGPASVTVDYNVVGVCGNIAEDTTWLTGDIYVATCNVTVDTGVTLTVEPGVIAKFTLPSNGLIVNGALRAQGTAAQPAVFTSYRDDSVGGDTNGDGTATPPLPGDWAGLQLKETSSSTHLEHCEVRYGQSGLAIDGGAPTIANSTIANNSGNGIYGTGDAAPVIHANVITGNAARGIWLHHGGPVTITENLVLANGQYGIQISAAADSPGLISENTISGNGIYGILLSSSHQMSVTNNTIEDNSSYAVYVEISTAPYFQDNTASGNAYNAIVVNREYHNGTWYADAGMPYIPLNAVVSTGYTLTIQPGTVVKGIDNPGSDFQTLRVQGALFAEGSADQPIIFTSARDDSVGGDTNGDGTATAPLPGDWIGLRLEGTSSSAHLEHCVVRYGRLGISTDSGALGVSNSEIYDNAIHGLYNASAILVDAKDNWWGSYSGPYHATLNPGGMGDQISDNVDFDPWSGKDVWVAFNDALSAYWSAFIAEPVNAVFGNYLYQRVDFSIPSRGLPFAFQRTYNSHATESGPLGIGWTHSYNLSVSPGISSTLIVRREDGRTDYYTPVGDGTYTPPPGIYDALVENVGGSYTLTRKDQVRYEFNAAGRLTAIYDRNSRHLTFGYSASNLITITDTVGRVYHLSYDGSDRLRTLSDTAGGTITYTYNLSNELDTVADPLGYATTYAYDADHRLVSITDANGHTFVHNTYDADGRVIEQRDAHSNLTTFVYDTTARETAVTDPRGNVTIYRYDIHYRITQEQDALGYIESKAYDGNNNIVRLTDRRGNQTQYSYDDRGNTTTITDALGSVISTTYDVQNNPLRRVDALGRVTTFEYDVWGNLITQTDALSGTTTYAYDVIGQPVQATGPEGHATLYGYDVYGNLTVITDALGHVSQATYDIAGRPLTETDPNGHTTTTTYDAADRVLTITDPAGGMTIYTYDAVGNRVSVTDPLSHTTLYGYDAKDQLVVITGTMDNTTTFIYDAVGNRTQEINALGYTTVYTYNAADRLSAILDPSGNVTLYAYDGNGNRTSVTDANGHTTYFQFDALNRQTQVTDPLGHTTRYDYDRNSNLTTLTDANGHVTRYGYDELDRLITVTDALSGVVTYTYDGVGNKLSMTDANGHVTQYTYDALGQPVSVTDPLSYTTVYTHDAAGNRVGLRDANGDVTVYTYDTLNRLVGLAYVQGTVTYAYDAIGNRTAMTDTIGTTAYQHDALYRLTSVTSPSGTLSYAYDGLGNRTAITYPDGSVVTSTYDATGRLAQVVDWAGRAVTYTYDAAGSLATQVYPNGIQTTYTYDDAGRLLVITHTSPVSGTFAFFRYTMDDAGNRTQMVDVDGTTDYTYDALYRLTAVAYPDGEQVAYAYDAMGNRTTLTSTVGGVVIYTYDAGDRLLAAGPITFTWDANGNMRTKGEMDLTFDARNRLTQVTSGTLTVSFAYNGDGVRVAKAVDGTWTTYIQDVGAPLPVVMVESTGSSTTRYVYGLDLTASDDGATWIGYHTDGLGSTRNLSNLSGQHTDDYSYDVFGTMRSHTGIAQQPYGFTGEQMDEKLGLIYLRARYYDPQMGRFLSPDTHPPVAHRPETINRYIYVGNNSVNRNDPTGLYWPEDLYYAANYVRTSIDLPTRLQPIYEGSYQEAGYCFEQGDLTQGIAFLALGAILQLDAAIMEINPVTSSPLQAAKITSYAIEMPTGAAIGKVTWSDLVPFIKETASLVFSELLPDAKLRGRPPNSFSANWWNGRLANKMMADELAKSLATYGFENNLLDWVVALLESRTTIHSGNSGNHASEGGGGGAWGGPPSNGK